MQPLGEPGDDAFLGQDQLPGVDLDEIARPQRHHHREIEQRLGPAARIARRVIGDRKGDDRAGERDERRHHHRAQDDLEVGLLEQLLVGRERELVDDEAGEIVERIEALQQQREQRADIDDADPQERRQQEKERQELRAREEEIGDRVEDPAALRRLSPRGSRAVLHGDHGRLGPDEPHAVALLEARRPRPAPRR